MFNERLRFFFENAETQRRRERCFALSLCASAPLRSIFTLLFLSIFCNLSTAQRGLSIEPSFHLGIVTKHTPKITFDVKGPTYGLDVNFKFQTYGKKEWHQWRNYPLFGITAMWLRFGNNDILGNAFSITPNVNISLFQRKKWKGFYQIGSGVAYMTKKFDVIENPQNNAIGSHLVTTIFMKFQTFRQINANWKFQAGLSLNHFSNGGSRLPNFGLNIPAILIGVNYTPTTVQPDQYLHHNISRKRIRKFGLDIQGGYGLVQRFAIGGPRYPIYVLGIGGNYYLNRVNRLIIGMEYEQNKAVYHFTRHTFHAMDRNEAKRKASRLTFFVGDEFLFGSISITLQMGVYLGNFSFGKLSPTYSKFTTRYYFPNKGFLKQKFFLSLALKTHLTVAEYISLGGGVNF